MEVQEIKVRCPDCGVWQTWTKSSLALNANAYRVMKIEPHNQPCNEDGCGGSISVTKSGMRFTLADGTEAMGDRL